MIQFHAVKQGRDLLWDAAPPFVRSHRWYVAHSGQVGKKRLQHEASEFMNIQAEKRPCSFRIF